ncbi:MAG: GFA family protein [Azospirillaceae bacterium]
MAGSSTPAAGTGAKAERHDGGCLCGAVRFTVHGPLRALWLCHCSQCRKWTGNAVAATAVRPGRFTLADPTAALGWYAASDHAERGFCRTCGSSLFWRPRAGDRISILAGSFDGATGLTPVGHVFVGEAADWEILDERLPRHDALPGEGDPMGGFDGGGRG